MQVNTNMYVHARICIITPQARTLSLRVSISAAVDEVVSNVAGKKKS